VHVCSFFNWIHIFSQLCSLLSVRDSYQYVVVFYLHFFPFVEDKISEKSNEDGLDGGP
jgi:hypothetical protein